MSLGKIQCINAVYDDILLGDKSTFLDFLHFCFDNLEFLPFPFPYSDNNISLFKFLRIFTRLVLTPSFIFRGLATLM